MCRDRIAARNCFRSSGITSEHLERRQQSVLDLFRAGEISHAWGKCVKLQLFGEGAGEASCDDGGMGFVHKPFGSPNARWGLVGGAAE